MRCIMVGFLAVLTLGTASGDLAAQSGAERLIAPSAEALAATALLRGTAPVDTNTHRAIDVLPMLQSRGDKRKGEILMIVGAAGILTGLLVDEDVVTIAGAGVGGFGLYLYLSATR